MLRRLGIRGKVLAALSVPVLVLFVLAGTVSWQSVSEVRTARAVTELLGALDSARALTVTLQTERAATLALVAAQPEDRAAAAAELGTVRAKTDAAILGAQRAAEATNLDVLDPLVDRAVTGLRDQLAELDTLRRAVDTGSVELEPAFIGYSLVVDRVASFPQLVADVLDDRPLAGIVTTQTEVMQLVEDYRQEQSLGAAVLDGNRKASQINALVELFPATDVQHESAALAVEQLRLGDSVRLPGLQVGNGTYSSFRGLAATGQNSYIEFLSSEDWSAGVEEEVDRFVPVQQGLRAAAIDRASDVANTALRTAVLTITATLLAVIFSVAIALAIARQIVGPLRRLTVAAGSVRDELPRLVEQVAIPGQGPDLSLTRIPVDTRDEIGQLAAAFNEVNATTIDVAREQAALRGSIAEMFVNVARRDQVLLNRQLSFIDALERSEEDPKTLADLFRLDHLATRMRRNAESLLVLAGIDTGRRLREALPTSDVIRTASSEIEHYERVQLDLPVDPMMLGHTALSAAHMLAELLENATVFSEPGTPVQVSTGIDESHVIVTILDQGLGMTPDELADANTKIRTTSAGDVLGSQRLGMFVVGRIAARLGATVELSLGPDGVGTLATVRMPRVLFLDPQSIPLTPPRAVAAAEVEAFVEPEEAAAVVHDTAFAPAPAHAQDVAAGAVGSAENPAEEVDLTALTDGTTGLGLPRRRSRTADVEAPSPSERRREQDAVRDADDAAAAASIPLAPEAESLAGAASTTAEAWTPPVIEPAAPLTARRPQGDATPAAAPSGLPTRRGAHEAAPAEPAAFTPASDASAPAAGLPTRRPAAPVTPPAAATPAAGPSQSAAGPERSAMFAGFRSRRAELAAAAVHVESSDTQDRPAASDGAPVDGADRLAAAAAFFGRGQSAAEPEATPPAEKPMVIPGLVEDDDWEQSAVPAAPEAVEETPAAELTDAAAAVWPPPAVEDSSQEPAPFPWAVEPVAETEPQWSPVPVADAEPQWSPVPVAEAEPKWSPVPVADSEPQWSAVAEPEPEWSAEPVAEAEPEWSAEPVAPEPVEEPAVSVRAAEMEAEAPAVAALPVAAASRRERREPRRRWWSFGRSREAVPAASTAASTAVPSAEVQESTSAEVLVEPAAIAPPVVWQAPQTAPVAEHVATIEKAPVAPVWSEPAAFTPEPPSSTPPAFTPEPVAFVPEPAPFAPEPAAFAPEPDVEAYVPGEDVPHPHSPWHGEAPQPAAPVQQQVPTWEPPVMPASVPVSDEAAWSPIQAWEPEAPAEAAQPVAETVAEAPLPARTPPGQTFMPQTFMPQTFTPEQDVPGGSGEGVNALAQRADIAQQALAELSQLSSYRPKAAGGGSTLARRTPGTIPAAPEIKLPSTPRANRDASQVRSLLSSFQSGTSRGRQAADGPADPGTTNSGQGERPAGSEDGSVDGHGNPVPTPDTDLNERSTSW